MGRAILTVSSNPAPSAQLGVSYALASMRTGAVLGELEPGLAATQLEGLAATLPDLFGTVDPSCLERISERLGGADQGDHFGEILLISPRHTHVIQPLTAQPGVALLAVSDGTSKIGLVLSAVRAQIDVLETG